MFYSISLAVTRTPDGQVIVKLSEIKSSKKSHVKTVFTRIKASKIKVATNIDLQFSISGSYTNFGFGECMSFI